MRYLRISCFWILVFNASTLGAQGPSINELRTGDRVRVGLVSPRRVATGSLMRATADSIRIRRDMTGDTLLLTWGEVQRLDVSLRQFTAAGGARRGARVGFAVGAGISALAIVLAIHADRRGGDYNVPATGLTAVYGVGFTAVTTVLGAAFGAAAPGEQWREVYRRR